MFLSACRLSSNQRVGRTMVVAAAVATDGDKVKVHYTGTLDDGSVFDTSRQEGREPLEFVLGAGQVCHGLDVINGVMCDRKICVKPQLACAWLLAVASRGWSLFHVLQARAHCLNCPLRSISRHHSSVQGAHHTNVQVVPGFEKAVSGLEVGNTKKMRSDADACYGEWKDEMVVTVPNEV
jgi:hypothetical protein